MPSVRVDAEELYNFASYLEHTAEAIRGRKQDVSAAFAHLSALWMDEKYRQFDESFHEILIYLDNFYRGAEIVVPHLREKANRIDEYLGRR